MTTLVVIPDARAQNVLNLPSPGHMVNVTSAYVPSLIKGITLHPENSLQFEFIVGRGDDQLKDQELQSEALKMIKYFMASLTVPDKEMWVNLSPHENDRIIADGLGLTEMGRDFLAQDYLLKQITSSLMYPEESLGESFWNRVHQRMQSEFGTTDIPVNTFNKVWIVPDKAVVYEHRNSAVVIDRHLKIMLEADYLSMKKGEVSAGDQKNYGQKEVESIIREILIPEIEREVNEGENFATLRQIYNAMILATWYKKNLKESILGKVYVDQNKVDGIDVEDKDIKYKIYERYLEAFKQGAYNYVKEDYDPMTQTLIPRKYFSGGLVGVSEDTLRVTSNREEYRQADQAMLVGLGDVSVTTDLLEFNRKQVGALQSQSADRAMVSVYPDQKTEVRIAPSILDVPDDQVVANFKESWRAGVELIHFDEMDGDFVRHRRDMLTNLRRIKESIDKEGYGFIRDFRDADRAKNPPLMDVHLMVREPSEAYFREYIEAGAQRLSFHVEAVKDVDATIAILEKLKEEVSPDLQIGVVLRPKTSVDVVKELGDRLDFVLLMTVDPGAGGQEFLPEVLEKVRDLHDYKVETGTDLDITVDGGVNRYYANQLAHSGATTLVAGGAIFKQVGEQYQENGASVASVAGAVEALRSAAQQPLVTNAHLEFYETLLKDVMEQIAEARKQSPKVVSISGVSPEQEALQRLADIYEKRLEEVAGGKRVPVPKYYHEFTFDNNDFGRVKKQVLDVLKGKVITYSTNGGMGLDGIRLADYLMDMDTLKETIDAAPSFRKRANVYLAFPDDVMLEVPQVIQEYNSGILGSEYRVIGDVLIQPQKMSAIILDFQFPDMNNSFVEDVLLKMKQMAEGAEVALTPQQQELVDFINEINQYGIPVMTLRQANMEADFILSARERHDRLAMVESGQVVLDNIVEVAESGPSNFAQWSALKEGDVVKMRGSYKGFAYVSIEQGKDGIKKFVNYFDNTDASSNDFRRKVAVKKEIVYEDFIYHPTKVKISDSTPTNASIDVSKVEDERSFLTSLMEWKEEPPDQAMLGAPQEIATESVQQELVNNPGGIDFNPELLDLQIKRDEQNIPLPLFEQPLENMQIEGFVPVIINIQPVGSIPQLLGLINTDQELASLAG